MCARGAREPTQRRQTLALLRGTARLWRARRTSIIAIIGSGPAAALAAVICATTSGWSMQSEHSLSAERACSSVSVGDWPPGGTIGIMAPPAAARDWGARGCDTSATLRAQPRGTQS
jgi:hypothetical protein